MVIKYIIHLIQLVNKYITTYMVWLVITGIIHLVQLVNKHITPYLCGLDGD